MPRFCLQCGCEHFTQEELEEQARTLLKEENCDKASSEAEQLSHEQSCIVEDSVLATLEDMSTIPTNVLAGEAPEEIHEELASKQMRKDKRSCH